MAIHQKANTQLSHTPSGNLMLHGIRHTPDLITAEIKHGAIYGESNLEAPLLSLTEKQLFKKPTCAWVADQRIR